MRLTRFVLFVAAVGAGGSWLPAQAQTSRRAYCNITSITSERLVNAVKVTIRADGLMDPDIQSRELFNVDAARMGAWQKLGKRVTEIPIRIRNARSQVGSIADVGVYPVSHVEVTVPPEALEGIGVDIRIKLYQPAITREIRLAHDRWNFSPEHEAPPFISIEQSQDRRAIVVIVTSDRRTPTPEQRRTPADPSSRTLEVSARDGFVSLYALGADLRDLVREMARATGVTIAAAAGLERSANLALDGVPLADALWCIARTYGASLEWSQGVWYLADGAVADPSAFQGSAIAEMPLRHVSAVAVRDSLPDVLLRHVHVDEGRNALTVAGPKTLVEKVAADVAKLDTPVPMVEIRATAVEIEDRSDMEALLTARITWPGGLYGLDPGAGDIVYSSLGLAGTDLQTALRALIEHRRARLRAETRTVVLNGRTARVFVGTRKQVVAQYFDFWINALDTRVLPISVGTSLEVTPWTSGAGTITARVRADASNIVQTEPRTGLPTVSQRVAETTVRLTDGETLYIGGLATDEDTRTQRGLLRSSLAYPRSRDAVAAHLAVFLTARIVPNPSERSTRSE